jgi:hypothetical protein
MGTFAADVARFAEKAKSQVDEAYRAIALSLLTKIVMRSPVGNPELWAANAEAMSGRNSYNRNVSIAADFAMARGVKKLPRSLKKKSRRALEKQFPFKAGKGYTGGRFRGNWSVAFDSPPMGTLDRIDPVGGQTIAEGSSVLAQFKAGRTIYIVNNLPYAHRLEYEGWSKQAPEGMVRVSIAEFQQIAAEAAAKIGAIS